MTLPFISRRTHDTLLQAAESERKRLAAELLTEREEKRLAQERLLMVLAGVPLYVRKQVKAPEVDAPDVEESEAGESLLRESLIARARRETGSSNAEVLRRWIQQYKDNVDPTPEPANDPSAFEAFSMIEDAIATGRAAAIK